MSEFTVAWIIWGAMFFAIEGPAVFNKQKGDTLTEHLVKLFAVRDKPPGYRLRRFTLLAILAWLVVHLLTGGSFV